MTWPAIPGLPRLARLGRLQAARLRHGRPLVLAARLATTFVLAAITLHTRAGPPPEAGALAGIATWLALTVRGDVAPPPGR